MQNPILCPDCDTQGLKAPLKETGPGRIYGCPRCGSRFEQSKATTQGILRGYGFGVFMGICSTMLLVLWIAISPSNPPWYYFVTGLAVLFVVYELMSKTVFKRMADKINMTDLRRIGGRD